MGYFIGVYVPRAETAGKTTVMEISELEIGGKAEEPKSSRKFANISKKARFGCLDFGIKKRKNKREGGGQS